MSGAGNIRWQVAPGQEHFKEEVLGLLTSFPQTGTPIYQERNVLKRMVWHGQPVIVKSFAKPNAIRRLIYGKLRKTKAEKSFANALRLKALGICTPEPIGFLEHYRNGGLAESFYVCEEWHSGRTIREHLSDATFTNREAVLASLGRFAWNLHQRGVYHRDFSPGNILLAKTANTADGENWTFCLVDINRMRFGSFLLSERMHNFAMLWATDADLEAIISAYVQASGDDLRQALRAALDYSRKHKERAMRKERLKTLLRLH
jgi:tRNA A-37 threonylcarbamoyl transferase component Bud32